MKTRVTDDCIGDGICAEICPEVFIMGDDGLAHVEVDVVPKGFEGKVKEAAEACPAIAIEIEE